MDKNYNVFKIAFASTDGYVIDTHFGRARDFYIYQFFSDESVFVEKRSVSPVCLGGSHLNDDMQKNIDQFLDCKYIVASRIGAGASSIMQSKGIIPMALPGEITDALDKIYNYNEIQSLFVSK